MDRFWKKVDKTDTCWNWLSYTTEGYGRFKLDKMRPAHRVAWYLTYHKWPDNQLDHICMNRACVNPEHLRECSGSQNCHNQKPRGGKSKFKGVAWYARRNKWQVKISVEGRRIHIGYFDSEEEAAKAYDESVRDYYGPFALTNEDMGLR